MLDSACEKVTQTDVESMSSRRLSESDGIPTARTTTQTFSGSSSRLSELSLNTKHPLFLVDEAIGMREGRTERCWRRLVQDAKRSWPECGPWTTSLTERQRLWKRAYERASGNVTALLLVLWATVFSVSQLRTNTCFHSGSLGCLGIWATPGRKHHISLEERTCSSRLPASSDTYTRHGQSQKPTSLFCSSGMSSLQCT